jgi:hypothetical protein
VLGRYIDGLVILIQMMTNIIKKSVDDTYGIVFRQANGEIDCWSD